MLGKIKESIDKSLVSVSVKSGTYLETEKLKAKVGNVQEEIHNLKQELGEAIFAQWKNGGVNPQTIESACAALKFCKACGKKLESGAEAAQETAQSRHCPSCGALMEPGARFCCECGHQTV